MGTDLWRTSGPNPVQAEPAGAGFQDQLDMGTLLQLSLKVELSVSPRMETAQTSLGNLFLCTTNLRV